jgi:hypothetical protein
VAENDSPNWVAEAITQLRSELSFFLRTAVDFTRHPGRFAKLWSISGVRRLNPLGFCRNVIRHDGFGRDGGRTHLVVAEE